MENKRYKNKLIYFVTIVVVIIVYLIIHLYGKAIREDIYLEKQGYENNASIQPINNIISIEKEQEDDNKVDGDKTKIIFLYDYDPANYIDLYDLFPMEDEVGKSLEGDKHTQDFKLKFNKKAVGVKYTITMEKLDGTDLEEDWTKAYLVRDGGDIPNCIRTTGRIKTFDEYTDYKGNPKEKILYEGVVTSAMAARGYEDYTFRMWVSEDVELFNEDYLSKTFKTRINVYAHE